MRSNANPFPILMNGQTLNTKDSFRLVSDDISNDLISHGNVVSLAVVGTTWELCAELANIYVYRKLSYYCST